MLEDKRHKVRLIQQRKADSRHCQELGDTKDLPQEIPLTLSIGQRVYAHITHPEVSLTCFCVAPFEAPNITVAAKKRSKPVASLSLKIKIMIQIMVAWKSSP